MAYTEEQRVRRRAYTRAWLKARPGYRQTLHTPEERKRREKATNDKHRARRLEWYRQRRITKRAEVLERDRLLRERKKLELRTYFRNYKASKKEDLQNYFRQYRKANPDKMRELGNRRRVAKKNQTTEDCSGKIKQLLQEESCHWCGDPLTKQNREIDHVIPISRGGLHCPDNLVAACNSCNCSKGAKLPNEWRPRKFEEAA